MSADIQVTAAILIPLLALTPSCTAQTREVRLQVEGVETAVHVAIDGGKPIEVPDEELWTSFHLAARELKAPVDPLTFAEQTFEVAEASGTYWYYPQAKLLVPGPLGGGLEEADDAAERMTREYLGWCGRTRLGGGDCLHLLAHSKVLTLHGRYTVALVMSMTASFGPMLDSLKEMADPNTVAVMLATAVAMYLVLWLVPEPISKLISLSITAALIGYLGLDMFWSLVYGWRALVREVDAATEFSQLRTAATNFGKVLGPQMGQLLILLVSHSLGKGLAVKGSQPPPRFAEAAAQSQKVTRVRLAAAAGVRSVALGSDVITISLTSGALMVGAPPSVGGRETAAPQGGKAIKVDGRGLARRFGRAPERISLLERVITAEGRLNTSQTVAKQLEGSRSYISTQSILDTIGSGTRVADPQGVAGQFMYQAPASFNQTQGVLEVLIHEESGQIRHVLFRSGS